MTRLAPVGASVFLACVALLLPCGALAAKKTPLEAAREQMAEASFEKALAIADAALKGTMTEPERAQFQLLRAEAFSALKRPGPMKEALESALLADATSAFDDATTNPELVEAMAAIRRRLAGKVSVAAPNSGGPSPEVQLDGESLGRAPVETTTTVGRHQVSLIWSGTSRVDVPVVVRSEKVTPVEVAVPESVAQEETARAAAVVAARPPSPAFRWPLIPVIAGGVVAVTGGVCLIVAGANYGALTGGDGTSTLQLDRTGAQAVADQGQAAQGVGIAFLSVGLAAAAAGGVAYFLGLDLPKVAFLPTGQGGALVFSGQLP